MKNNFYNFNEIDFAENRLGRVAKNKLDHKAFEGFTCHIKKGHLITKFHT